MQLGPSNPGRPCTHCSTWVGGWGWFLTFFGKSGLGIGDWGWCTMLVSRMCARARDGGKDGLVNSKEMVVSSGQN